MGSPQNILNFLPADAMKHKGGGEWAGPCPGCGGVDRFIVWPERPRGGAFLCRGCDARGDGIQFLRDFRGMGYAEACQALGIPAKNSQAGARWHPSGASSAGPAKSSAARPVPAPGPASFPGEAWRAAAAAFLATCRAEPVRGLSLETCQRLGILRNNADAYQERRAWGLDPVTGSDGKPRTKILLPRGIVIPTRRRAGVVALTVRCDDADREAKGRAKYREIMGSGKVPFLAGQAGCPVVLVESALDAALVWQESGGRLTAVALMGNMKGLDQETAAFIQAAPAVIACPDYDDGGRTGWERWHAAFPMAKVLPPVEGKDLGESPEACGLWCELALEAVAGDVAQEISQAEEVSPAERPEDVAPVGQNKIPEAGKIAHAEAAALPLEPLSLPWTPDEWKGRPCCILPQVPTRLRGLLPGDLRGMGIPKEGLPPFLRGISACGWTLELLDGRLELRQARPDARNADGVRGYLRACRDDVAAAWRLWTGGARCAS